MSWIIMIILVIIAIEVIKAVKGQQYKKLEKAVLKDLGFSGWNSVPYFDKYSTVFPFPTPPKSNFFLPFLAFYFKIMYISFNSWLSCNLF